MQVILLEDVKGIGRKHEVKTVSGGYARNFLLPKRLVVPATPSAIREIEGLKARAERENAELMKQLTERARAMEGKFIEFRLKTDATGSVFGSVTKEMVLKALREHRFIGPEHVEVKLDHPLKHIGDHPVAVDFKKGVAATITIKIVPEER